MAVKVRLAPGGPNQKRCADARSMGNQASVMGTRLLTLDTNAGGSVGWDGNADVHEGRFDV